MRNALAIGVITVAYAVSGQASTVPTTQIDLTVNLTSTKNFNNISDVVILATNGVNTTAQFVPSIASSGQTILRSSTLYTPFSMLVMGMEGPAASPTCIGDGTVCNGNDTGNHAFFLVNNAFAATMAGQHFSVAFGLNGYHETEVLQNLLAANTGNAAAVTYLTNFFLSSDGQRAAFSPGDTFTALEFFIGTPVGNGTSTGSPEPATYAWTGICTAALAFASRKLRRT